MRFASLVGNTDRIYTHMFISNNWNLILRSEIVVLDKRIVLETESQLIFMLLYARLSYVRYHFIQQGISIVRVYHRKWNVFNILRSNYTLSRITQIRFCNPMHWNAQRHCTLCPLYEIRLDKTALSSIS